MALTRESALQRATTSLYVREYLTLPLPLPVPSLLRHVEIFVSARACMSAHMCVQVNARKVLNEHKLAHKDLINTYQADQTWYQPHVSLALSPHPADSGRGTLWLHLLPVSMCVCSVCPVFIHKSMYSHTHTRVHSQMNLLGYKLAKLGLEGAQLRLARAL